MNKIPLSPRYARCRAIARECLVKYSNNTLPIDVLDLIAKSGKATIKRYSDAMAEFDISLLEAQSTFGSKDGSVMRIPGRKRDIIHYNDLQNVSGRITWSLAHEFGHIALGHLDDYEMLIYNRSGLSDPEYKVLEKEADTFASELLAPLCVLAHMDIPNMYRLSEVTGLSDLAAKNTFEALRKYKREPSNMIDGLAPLNSFHNFVYGYQYLKVMSAKSCIKCNSYMPHKINRNYCHICGSPSNAYHEMKNSIVYADITNANHYKCTKPGCKTTLDQNSRFCHACGTGMVGMYLIK